MTQGLAKATAVLFTGSITAHAVPLLLGPALTRTYSPETFGQFALLWAAATNIASAKRAIESFSGNVVVILGGRYKGGRFEDLRDVVRMHANAAMARQTVNRCRRVGAMNADAGERQPQPMCAQRVGGGGRHLGNDWFAFPFHLALDRHGNIPHGVGFLVDDGELTERCPPRA